MPFSSELINRVNTSTSADATQILLQEIAKSEHLENLDVFDLHRLDLQDLRTIALECIKRGGKCRLLPLTPTETQVTLFRKREYQDQIEIATLAIRSLLTAEIEFGYAYQIQCPLKRLEGIPIILDQKSSYDLLHAYLVSTTGNLTYCSQIYSAFDTCGVYIPGKKYTELLLLKYSQQHNTPAEISKLQFDDLLAFYSQQVDYNHQYTIWNEIFDKYPFMDNKQKFELVKIFFCKYNCVPSYMMFSYSYAEVLDLSRELKNVPISAIIENFKWGLSAEQQLELFDRLTATSSDVWLYVDKFDLLPPSKIFSIYDSLKHFGLLSLFRYLKNLHWSNDQILVAIEKIACKSEYCPHDIPQVFLDLNLTQHDVVEFFKRNPHKIHFAPGVLNGYSAKQSIFSDAEKDELFIIHLTQCQFFNQALLTLYNKDISELEASIKHRDILPDLDRLIINQLSWSLRYKYFKKELYDRGTDAMYMVLKTDINILDTKLALLSKDIPIDNEILNGNSSLLSEAAVYYAEANRVYTRNFLNIVGMDQCVALTGLLHTIFIEFGSDITQMTKINYIETLQLRLVEEADHDAVRFALLHPKLSSILDELLNIGVNDLRDKITDSLIQNLANLAHAKQTFKLLEECKNKYHVLPTILLATKFLIQLILRMF